MSLCLWWSGEAIKSIEESLYVTKADIAEKIQARTNITKKESVDLMEVLFGIIKGTLESGENLKIHGFGNFEVKQKADRKGRNPQTGETITIGARRVLTFKPSNVLRQAINGGVE